MHPGYNDLETIIEDELLNDNFEHEPVSDEIYGLEFDESYQIDPEHFEPNEAIEELQKIPIESNFNEPAITELESDFQEEMGSTRNLAYVFIATTAVAIITVIVLLMRKPKKVWL